MIFSRNHNNQISSCIDLLINAKSMLHRGVAQPGSAPALGAGSRRFKSSRPDQPSKIKTGSYCELPVLFLIKEVKL